jgi:hypothetical protein
VSSGNRATSTPWGRAAPHPRCCSPGALHRAQQADEALSASAPPSHAFPRRVRSAALGTSRRRVDGSSALTQTGAMAFEPTGKAPLAYVRDGKPHRETAGHRHHGMDGKHHESKELSSRATSRHPPSRCFRRPGEALAAQAVAAAVRRAAKMGQRPTPIRSTCAPRCTLQASTAWKGRCPHHCAVRAPPAGALRHGRPSRDTVYSAACAATASTTSTSGAASPTPNCEDAPTRARGARLDPASSRVPRGPIAPSSPPAAAAFR